MRNNAPANLLEVKYDFLFDLEEEEKKEVVRLVQVSENPHDSDSDDDPDLSSSHCDVVKDDFQTRLKLSKFLVKGETKDSPKLFHQAKAKGKKIAFDCSREERKIEREDTFQWFEKLLDNTASMT